jgi:2-polyprenyl-6-methoxyphenol hydroxylase-like FAD-dependent oxidoreductase
MTAAAVIVGAGPVGLMLAGELRLGGVDTVVVLERRAEPSGESRGVGFTERAYEVFDQRGLYTRFENAARGQQVHFGGVHIDPEILEESHYGVRGVPQYRVEEVLEDWLRELGTSVRRGHAATGLRDTGDTVVVDVDGPEGRYELSADYLVGCDGGRSTIRSLAGFDFPGVAATRGMYLADIVGADLRPRFIGERVAGGMVMSIRLQDGVDRIIIHEDDAPPPDTSRAPNFADIADTWQRLTGESVHGAEVRWVSAFTDATRQTSQYRRGRVFLAGDAAHIHIPAGAQGLSVGVQDAVNLGWKLAAVITGWAPDGLLETYHSERHPVGARVLRNTRAQAKLYLSGAEMDPLRKIMGS